MTARDRLNEVYTTLLIAKKVSNKSDFASRLGYNRSYISELFNAKKEVTDLFAQSLESKFQVSAQWLLTGKGQMQPGQRGGTSYAAKEKTSRQKTEVNEDIAPYIAKASNTPIVDLLAQVLKDIDDLKKQIKK